MHSCHIHVRNQYGLASKASIALNARIPVLDFEILSISLQGRKERHVEVSFTLPFVSKKHVHCKVTLISRWTEPDYDMRSPLVDGAHEGDLFAFFVFVALIDAYLIYPNPRDMLRMANGFEEVDQAPCHLDHTGALAQGISYRYFRGVGWISPCIRECLEGSLDVVQIIEADMFHPPRDRIFGCTRGETEKTNVLKVGVQCIRAGERELPCEGVCFGV